MIFFVGCRYFQHYFFQNILSRITSECQTAWIYRSINSLPNSGEFCHLTMIFVNSLHRDQARQNDIWWLDNVRLYVALWLYVRLYAACNSPIRDETAEVHCNVDNHIQNFHLGRYSIRYTFGNQILLLRRRVTVKHDLWLYIPRHTSPNEDFWIQLSPR